MLHQHIMDFFTRIEFETGDFDEAFFGDDFIEIVDRHPKILKQRCIDIYYEIKDWDQKDKTDLCEEIRRSNDLENICKRNYVPPIIDRHVTGIRGRLRVLFLALYNQVLDGNGFREKYGTTLRQHFNDFSDLNEDITLCPICGISELKKAEDETRDQYDHYLPKALYPYSSVNFANLVPSCKECNSFDAKGEKDILNVGPHPVFFPYDNTHKGITLDLFIQEDNYDTRDITWHIVFNCPDGRANEIKSWNSIYRIESRYRGFVKARIEKWYRQYWEYMNDSDLSHLSLEDRELTYNKWLDKDEEVSLSFIRKPALIGFKEDSMLAKAELEARLYM